MRDHPRMCGEKQMEPPGAVIRRGSPPHVRGKDAGSLDAGVDGGITPACAGKSQPTAPAENRSWDHPRMCGEKLFSFLLRSGTRGSPPHVRGKGRCRPARGWRSRITPACAGKSVAVLCVSSLSQDHPRMCGEKFGVFYLAVGVQGSPPHVRGKVGHVLVCRGGERITPACAGKSGRMNSNQRWKEDHPRMCGEKFQHQSVSLREAGSPPHVRGKAMSKSHLPTSCGITPACAGKRRPAVCHVRKDQDHPRMCGEKCTLPGVNALKEGSPPHVRGKD